MAGKIATRTACGETLAELGAQYPELVVLDADLSGSTMSKFFADAYPERLFNCGIAEADMACIAAGMAAEGLKPFTNSFAMFATGRAYEQIRNSIGYPHLNVKIVGSHGGVSVGEDGATHQCLEDIALMRALPDMVVINPCDYNQTKAATIAAAKYDGPVYLRFGRPSVPNFTPADEPFEIGKAYVMNEGKDVTIFATGHLVWESLSAAEALEAEGISAEVIDIATIKPLDEAAVIASARKTGAVVCAEEHNVCGGLGELVAGVLALNCPTPVEFINGGDRFGQTGTPKVLMEAYGLDAAHIAEAAKKAISRK